MQIVMNMREEREGRKARLERNTGERRRLRGKREMRRSEREKDESGQPHLRSDGRTDGARDGDKQGVGNNEEMREFIACQTDASGQSR